MSPGRIQRKWQFMPMIMLLAVMLIRCQDKPVQPKPYISRAQSFLISLKDSLEAAYAKAETDTEKKTILKDCRTMLDEWVWNHGLDSITVTIDEVSIKGWTIETSCHNAFTQFKFRLTYTDRDHPDRAPIPKMDSLFQFTKALKRGSRAMLNFDYTGACQVNDPFAKGEYPFRIFAFLIPLNR